MKKIDARLPELLSPAGSPDALRAAVAAGADAVYFGTKAFSARAFAENFDNDSLASAIRYCRDFGVKSYITVNTQLFDRELSDAAETVRIAANMGADAFIVADLGLAKILREIYPGIELHASTQASGQNRYSADVLASLGFRRMVVPREISLEDLKILVKNAPLETEMFIHGALCVSHSGQCLMSSVIGGRSGNRGECAQPCRLPYDLKNNKYPLSLKDLCLASHMTEIIGSGVSSLKIEGRMKSPDYVFGVTRIYRRLLDERRNAEPDELDVLSKLFSRSGFTSGYFTGNIDEKMLGVRTDDNKRESVSTSGAKIPEMKIPIVISGRFICGEPAALCGRTSIGGKEVVRSVKGGVVAVSGGEGMKSDRAKGSLCKLGGTVFSCSPEDIELELDDKAIMSVSEINSLRRQLCAELENALVPKKVIEKKNYSQHGERILSSAKTAYFVNVKSITSAAVDYFDKIFVPLSKFEEAVKTADAENIGVAFPPVALDTELERVDFYAAKAASLGCKSALITGLWQAPIAKKYGFEMTGDLRLNVCNSQSSESLSALGINKIILSCEAGLSRSAGIRADAGAGVVVYGRLPLMTLEKCVIRDLNGIRIPRNECHFCDSGRFTTLTDRVGAKFVLCREEAHRNILWNSVPVWMADKAREINSAGLFSHFIFTDENAENVNKIIASFERGDAPKGAFKRI